MQQKPKLEEEFSHLFKKQKGYKSIQIDGKTQINSLSLSSNFQYLAFFCNLNQVSYFNIWNLYTLKLKQSIELEEKISGQGMCQFSKDDKFLFFANKTHNRLQIIWLESRRPKITKCVLGGPFISMSISQNPKYCCTITPQQCLLWNQNTQKIDQKIESELDFICCCFNNDDKELITIQYLEFEQTQFNRWNTRNYKIIKQWSGRYIAKQGNCFVIKDKQILIVNFFDEQENYIQIWCLTGCYLIRSLYQALDSFYIKKIYDSRLIIECDIEECEEEQDDNSQNLLIGFFDMFTFKYYKYKSLMDYNVRYFVFEDALIMSSKKKNSNQGEITINYK